MTREECITWIHNKIFYVIGNESYLQGNRYISLKHQNVISWFKSLKN